MSRAMRSASSGDLASLTPPPLPRPPAWICALTTTTLAAEVTRDLAGLGGFEGHLAPRHRHAVLRQNRFCLILVDFHRGRKRFDANLRLFAAQQ